MPDEQVVNLDRRPRLHADKATAPLARQPNNPSAPTQSPTTTNRQRLSADCRLTTRADSGPPISTINVTHHGMRWDDFQCQKADTTAFPCMRWLIAVLDFATRMRFWFQWILQATGGTGRPIMFGPEVSGAFHFRRSQRDQLCAHHMGRRI